MQFISVIGRSSGTFVIVGILTVLTASIFPSRTVVAQSSSLKPGDEVQAHYLGKWHPARVVETNRRGDVLAEFEFAGRPQRRAFKRAEVRFPFEEDAIVPARNWSDASGQFNIRAALIRIDEGSVTLRKPDLKEVKVEISKLSETDQAFLKKLQKEMGPAAARPPEPPPVEDFQQTVSTSIWTQAPLQSIPADPVPAYLALQEGGAAFPTLSVFDRLGAVIPLGGTDSWLLAAVESRSSEDHPTRVLWASLAKKSITNQQLLPPGEVVLDYHPSSHRLLTFWTDDGFGNDKKQTLTIWETLPADKQIKPIIRWNAKPDGHAGLEPWGRLITGDLVLHRWADHEYVAWDIKAKRILYRIKQESFFAPLPTLSGGRKYLFLPEDQRVRVFDATSGSLFTVLPSEDGAAGVAITEDGTRAAVLGRTTLRIWDLAASPPTEETLQAEGIGTPFRSRLRWVDSEMIWADNGHQQVVFSLKHRLPLWNYVFDLEAVRESEGRRLRDIVAGHLVFAASLRSGTDRGLAVGAVKLPGPKVAEASATLDPESLMVLKAGSAVRLVVRAGTDQQRVQAALEKEIAANGWRLDPSAPITITAEMRQGETQQVTYESIGFGGGGSQTVTVTPLISEVKIEVGMDVAWHSQTRSGVPPVLQLNEGASAQSEVSKYQSPNAAFFESLDIPQRILDPAKRLGIGRTKVSSRGLIAE